MNDGFTQFMHNYLRPKNIYGDHNEFKKNLYWIYAPTKFEFSLCCMWIMCVSLHTTLSL